MNQEIKKEWVKRLRGNGYAQGTGELRGDYREGQAPEFCSLGVLCDVLADMGLGQWNGTAFTWKGNESTNYTDLPYDALRAIGLYGYESQRIIELNDGKLLNFKQIADYVEEML